MHIKSSLFFGFPCLPYCFLVSQSCQTLYNPPGFSVPGISQARVPSDLNITLKFYFNSSLLLQNNSISVLKFKT